MWTSVSDGHGDSRPVSLDSMALATEGGKLYVGGGYMHRQINPTLATSSYSSAYGEQLDWSGIPTVRIGTTLAWEGLRELACGF